MYCLGGGPTIDHAAWALLSRVELNTYAYQLASLS